MTTNICGLDEMIFFSTIIFSFYVEMSLICTLFIRLLILFLIDL